MDPGKNGKGQGNASYHQGDWHFLYLKRFKRGGQGMNRICKIIWSHVRNGYVVVFELAKGRGKVAAQKLVRILTAAVLGMILSGAALPAYTATLTMLVTSDLTHPIAGPCFLLGPDGQPVQITGDGNAEKAPTVVIMGSLNGVKLRAIPLTARKFHCGAGQLYGKRQFSPDLRCREQGHPFLSRCQGQR